jgi:hypothetical protein
MSINYWKVSQYICKKDFDMVLRELSIEPADKFRYHLMWNQIIDVVLSE